MKTAPFWLEDDVYWRFRDLVQAHSGLSFPEKKRRDLELALDKALQDAPKGIHDPDAYYRYLRYDATPAARRERARFINLLTVGETHLFRDSAQFDALATQVLPALIARKREMVAKLGTAVNPQLRIWSAGCSTGEEPYSLAILLRELIPDIAQWRILILATDINEESLKQAQQAIYSDWSFRESRAKVVRPLYFAPCGSGYQLHDDLRRMVTFAPHNLIDDDFPAVINNTVFMDLIICRNVTIYFEPMTTRRIVNQFYQALVEGGWLVVGHAEPSVEIYKEFTGHMIQGALLYQKLTARPAVKPPLTRPPAPAKPAVKPPRRTDLLPPLPLHSPPTTNGSGYEEARQLLSHGRVEPAITLLEDYVAANTQFAAAHCLLARAYADLGQWHQARAWCQKAMTVDPLLPEVYYILAMIEEHEGQLELAISNLKKVVYLDQERPLAYFNLAILYKKRSQADLAQRALKAVINRIQAWPADKIIPDSGHTSGRRLAEAARQLLAELENES